jgi:hypothetical protein
MARPKKTKEISTLASAVDFCKFAGNETTEAYTKHLVFAHGYVLRFDGIVQVAYPCLDAIGVAPNFELLQKALARVGADFEIVVSDANEMLVKGKKLRAVIPTLSAADMPLFPPHGATVYITDDAAFRGHLARVARIASDNAEHVMTASVLLWGTCATATDRTILAQTMHGYNFETPLAIPKTAIAALLKTTLPIVSIGYDASACTFWFENGAFMRTQLYSEAWPDFEHLLPSNPAEFSAVPKDFFEAVETIAPFSESGHVWVDERGVSSNAYKTQASTYEIKYKEMPFIASAKRLLWLADFVDKVDFTEQDKLTFFGPQFRASLSKVRG